MTAPNGTVKPPVTGRALTEEEADEHAREMYEYLDEEFRKQDADLPDVLPDWFREPLDSRPLLDTLSGMDDEDDKDS